MIRQAKEQDTGMVHDIVCRTIKEAYSRHYAPEVVDYFLDCHNTQNIHKDISNGDTYIVEINGECIGTGSHNGNYISRVFIHPDFQGRGYGTEIVDHLEKLILQDHEKVFLHSAVTGHQFYLRHGYSEKEAVNTTITDGAVFKYIVMEKNNYNNYKSNINK